MSITQAPDPDKIAAESHGRIHVAGIPCDSVCFRGELLEVNGDDITQARAIHPDQVLEMTRS
jgi:hypothetical protein